MKSSAGLSVLVTACAAIMSSLVGCNEPMPERAETLVSGFQDSYLRHRTLDELDRRGIWYEPVGDNAIRIRQSDLEEITSITREIAYEITPPGRSVSYSGAIRKEFLGQLGAKGIDYELVLYGDLGIEGEPGPVEWIVWSEEDSAEVAHIQQALERDLLWEDPDAD